MHDRSNVCARVEVGNRGVEVGPLGLVPTATVALEDLRVIVEDDLGAIGLVDDTAFVPAEGEPLGDLALTHPRVIVVLPVADDDVHPAGWRIQVLDDRAKRVPKLILARAVMLETKWTRGCLSGLSVVARASGNHLGWPRVY